MAPRDYPNISMGLLTKSSFQEWETVRELFNLWHEYAPNYFPNRFDVIEPIRRPLSIETLESMKEVWEMIVFFKRTKSPWVEASCSIEAPYELKQRYSCFHLGGESNTGVETELIKFLQMASISAPADFAYAHIVNDIERVKDSEKQIDTIYTCGRNDKYPSLSIANQHLSRGIPNLYWCTILGKERIAEIGRAKLSDCPVYKVQWLSDDLVMLQLTESIHDCRERDIEFEKLREKVKTYLGVKFFQPLSWPPGYRPFVDILNEIASKNLKKNFQ